jgi:RNase P subunit RPR2
MTFETCLRCGSTERYLVPADGENWQLHISGSFKKLNLTIYVCGECGYVERFVVPEHLPLMRERSKRVSAAG